MTNLPGGWIDIAREKPPADKRPKLVVLAEETLGSRVHVMTNEPNRYGQPIVLIGGYFSFDMPKILYWKIADLPPDTE